MAGNHHHLAIADIGVRPIQGHVPVLIGGNGRRLIEVAGRFADIFQFTGLTHGPDGPPEAGGFALESVTERARWLADGAGERDSAIERSVLVQRAVIGSGAEAAAERATGRLGITRAVVESTPFLLYGSVDQVAEKLRSLRDGLGISHVVVREAAEFAPVVAILAGE